jgi:hypothetical protein
MAIPIISAALSLVGTVGKLFENWQKKKLVTSQGKIDIEKAVVKGKIELDKAIQLGDKNYNVEAQKGMASSIKDEMFVVVWLAILIAAFLPWTQPYIKSGFAFLATGTPWWYETSLIGMVVASFGLKGWKMWKKP